MCPRLHSHNVKPVGLNVESLAARTARAAVCFKFDRLPRMPLPLFVLPQTPVVWHVAVKQLPLGCTEQDKANLWQDLQRPWLWMEILADAALISSHFPGMHGSLFTQAGSAALLKGAFCKKTRCRFDVLCSLLELVFLL